LQPWQNELEIPKAAASADVETSNLVADHLLAWSEEGVNFCATEGNRRPDMQPASRAVAMIVASGVKLCR